MSGNKARQPFPKKGDTAERKAFCLGRCTWIVREHPMGCHRVENKDIERRKEKTMSRHATFWALIPPVAAILLALITKEVYSPFLSELS